MSSLHISSHGGSSSSDKSPSCSDTFRSSTAPQHHSIDGRPKYMTIGTGSTSSSAITITQMLEHDSESGKRSPVETTCSGRGPVDGEWQAELTVDRPAAEWPPTLLGEVDAATEQGRPVHTGYLKALRYNQNRNALHHFINQTTKILQNLQEMNAKWPAHYPSVQQHVTTLPREGDLQSRTFSCSSQSEEVKGEFATHNQEGESSKHTDETRIISEPRLITAQIAPEFFILKLDLKIGALSQTELVHSLEKSSIASLLDGKISQSVRHLLALRDRIEDTSSKVLITGDLNSGKSTFCNALLRRKVLPEDQQPCTSIFCEVLNVRDNGGVEEVHAVLKGATYNRNNEATYDVFKLEDLEHVVGDSVRYTQAKIFLEDIRPMDQSLLNNGIVDISIIDAPGLNKDSLKTTAILSRQEEIDVVVFVVSAENHFTLSAEEFIRNAAHEKAYMFMVVNRFDNIRDQDRCQRLILNQVQALSPHTFKESAELVHFVSSNAIPFGINPGSGIGKPEDDDDPSDKDKGKGKEEEHGNLQDFEYLEECLRRFILEKRARSKLAPAKTYLLNMLSDLGVLATVNRAVAQSEIDRVLAELNDLEPVYEQSKKTSAQVSKEIDSTINQTARSIYASTHSELSSTISRLAEHGLSVPYPGLFGTLKYVESLKTTMLLQISEAVMRCEQQARNRTVQGVCSIASLGLPHLDEEFSPLNFHADIMFKRRRDVMARHVDANTNIWDFFALDALIPNQEKIAGTGVAMTLVTLLGGRTISGFGWADGVLGTIKIMGLRNARMLLLPSLLLATASAAAYILHQIPTFLPRHLGAKLSASMIELDFTHKNSERISGEVRKILRLPAENLRVGLRHSLEKLTVKREMMGKVKSESEVARKYFAILVRESGELRSKVDDIDLEGLRET